MNEKQSVDSDRPNEASTVKQEPFLETDLENKEANSPKTELPTATETTELAQEPPIPNTNPPVQEETSTKETESPPEEPLKPKKAAGEAFQELKSEVIGMGFKLDEINRFVLLAKDKLVRQADEYANEGKMKVLGSFFELHDMLFRRVMAMEAGSLEPESFSIELMEYVQTVLKKHGVEVIIPQPGDRFDMNYMESLRGIPARFWRSPDTVANVENCGYTMQINETDEKLLRPARVNVYRKVSK